MEDVVEEIFCGFAVTGVSRRDLRRGDDLRVRVLSNMTFIPIEAVRRGLVPVTGVRVNR